MQQTRHPKIELCFYMGKKFLLYTCVLIFIIITKSNIVLSQPFELDKEKPFFDLHQSFVVLNKAKYDEHSKHIIEGIKSSDKEEIEKLLEVLLADIERQYPLDTIFSFYVQNYNARFIQEEDVTDKTSGLAMLNKIKESLAKGFFDEVSQDYLLSYSLRYYSLEYLKNYWYTYTRYQLIFSDVFYQTYFADCFEMFVYHYTFPEGHPNYLQPFDLKRGYYGTLPNVYNEPLFTESIVLEEYEELKPVYSIIDPEKAQWLLAKLSARGMPTGKVLAFEYKLMTEILQKAIDNEVYLLVHSMK